MNAAVRAGIVLAVIVTALNLIFIGAGIIEKNLVLSQLLFVALAIATNVAVVFWALSRTAAEKTYGSQLASAVVLGIVGGVLIFIGAWLMLAVVFPDSMDGVRAAAADFYAGSGLPQEQIDKAMDQLNAATPVSQSLSGAFFTVLTSAIVGAIVAIFKRRKG